MKKQVLAASAALFLSAICLGAMRAVPARAAAQETAEKAKVELRKENETKEVVKPQEEKAETAQENETQTGTEETDVVEEVAEAEKERRTLWAVSVLLLQTRLSAQV